MIGESLYELYKEGKIVDGDELIYKGTYVWRVLTTAHGADDWFVNGLRLTPSPHSRDAGPGPMNDDPSHWEFADSFKAWVREVKQEESCQTV